MMEKPEPQIEQKENGRDVTIHAVFTRHGEKIFDVNNPHTDLTPKGEAISLESGHFRPEVDAIKSYSSDTPRTKKTAQLIVEGSPTENKMDQRLREELEFRYDPEGEFAKSFAAKKRELFAGIEDMNPDEQRAKLDEVNNILTDYYLSFGDKRPDEGSDSPVETAAMLARAADRYIRMADKLKASSEIDLINATHDFNIAAFLKEVMIRNVDGKEVRGFDSINEIGGNIDFNDSFEILIKTDEQGEKIVKLLFRGEEYDIDQDRLTELIKIAKDLEKSNKNEE